VEGFNATVGSQVPRVPWSFLHRPRLPLLLALLTAGCGGGDGGSPTPPPPGPDVLQAVGTLAPQGLSGAVLPGAPTVRLVGDDGSPRSGARVLFTVTAGGGEVSQGPVSTDASGVASTLWILGPGEGPQRLEARSGEQVVAFETAAVAPGVGERYVGAAEYVEYLPGDLPIVLSAGHGGTLRPASIPDRTQGVTTQDRNTVELALRLADALEARLGGRPHLVLSHLHRIKLDPNRELGEAAQGNPVAGRAWWEYHAFLERARSTVEEDHGEGLYVDVHGHGHVIPRVELGYLLSAATLALDDASLSAPEQVERSSLRGLVRPSGATLAELVRGPLSLGARLLDEGIPAVPSPAAPSPGSDPYFSGGYSTARYGSRDGGGVSGIQVEAHFPGVRDTDENRTRFAGILADALMEFFRDHLGTDPAPR
jgi:hypothetical protein